LLAPVRVHPQIFECHGSYYSPGYLERYNVQAYRSIIGFSLYFAVAFVDSRRFAPVPYLQQSKQTIVNNYFRFILLQVEDKRIVAKSKKKNLSDPTRLSPFDSQKPGVVIAVIETPGGSRNKFKYDKKLGFYSLAGVLPEGCSRTYSVSSPKKSRFYGL
jgi:hypothetical protein